MGPDMMNACRGTDADLSMKDKDTGASRLISLFWSCDVQSSTLMLYFVKSTYHEEIIQGQTYENEILIYFCPSLRKRLMFLQYVSAECRNPNYFHFDFLSH